MPKKKPISVEQHMHQSYDSEIVLEGVRTHNLKNIDITLPKNKIITVTGVSGS
jgi:excinuclease ABC subunit A